MLERREEDEFFLQKSRKMICYKVWLVGWIGIKTVAAPRGSNALLYRARRILHIMYNTRRRFAGFVDVDGGYGGGAFR